MGVNCLKVGVDSWFGEDCRILDSFIDGSCKLVVGENVFLVDNVCLWVELRYGVVGLKLGKGCWLFFRFFGVELKME